MTMIERMTEKIEELGPQLEGYKLSDRVLLYMGLCKEAGDFALELMEQTQQHHLSLVPMVTELDMMDNGTDPRLWFLVYQDIRDDPDAPDMPIEALVAARLSISGHHLRYRGVRDMMTDDGELAEFAYGFAVAGIEEDWWDHDDLVTLPDRESAAVQAMAAVSMMDEVMADIGQMLGEGDGPDEGWFA
jgi:hypothetical protein